MMISYEIGCRFFQLSYPFEIAEKGKCIVSKFEINPILNDSSQDNSVPQLSLDNFPEIDLSKINLKLIDLNERIYESDIRPIDENCSCFTCKNKYTRAYIHHLLKCKELNATLLIITHNLHFSQNLYNIYTDIRSEHERLTYLYKFISEQCEVA